MSKRTQTQLTPAETTASGENNGPVTFVSNYVDSIEPRWIRTALHILNQEDALVKPPGLFMLAHVTKCANEECSAISKLDDHFPKGQIDAYLEFCALKLLERDISSFRLSPSLPADAV